MADHPDETKPDLDVTAAFATQLRQLTDWAQARHEDEHADNTLALEDLIDQLDSLFRRAWVRGA